MISRVPRPIQTRGTPDGYYEIPCTQLIRIYTNTSSGFWLTDQVVPNSQGTTGYKGIGVYFKNDQTYFNFGNNGSSGGIAATQNFGIRDYANLAAVFDDMKIARITVEAWMNVDPSAINHNPNNCPEIWMCHDGNDAFPPNEEIQEYAKSVRVLPNRRASISFVPTATLDTTSDAGSGSTTGPGLTTGGYFRSSSSASLYGLKIYNWLPYEPDTSQVYFLQLKITQVRRFRRQK